MKMFYLDIFYSMFSWTSMESLTIGSLKTNFNPYPSTSTFFTSLSSVSTIPPVLSGETINGSSYAVDFTKTLIPAKYQVILLSFAYGIISLLAVLGNSCIIYIVFRNRRMHSVTNYFICNLALADCLVACFAIPFQVGCFPPLFSFNDHFLRLLLIEVSSSCSSKMGFTSFSLQISSIRPNTFRRCVNLHTGCCLARSLPCHATSIKAKAINKSSIYHLSCHLADCAGLVNT